MGSGGQSTLESYSLPWANSDPTLHSPFASRRKSQSSHCGRSESDCLSNSSRGSSPFTSATTSPTCSPYSSPTSSESRKYSDNQFTRLCQRSKNSFSALSPRLRRLSSPFSLRRRPSSVELALSEERSRCNEDSTERIGLGLMEPRPVDSLPTVADEPSGNAVYDSLDGALDDATNNDNFSGDMIATRRQPRYVMGGIFEVMEGTA